MIKKEKCSYGYLKERKMKSLIRIIVGLIIVLAILFIGIIINHTRNNICTVISVVLVLPLGKFAVDYFVLIPHKNTQENIYNEVEKEAGDLMTCYDCIFSNSKKPVGAQAVVVNDNSIILYSIEKADAVFIENSIRDFLKNDKLNVNVTFYNEKEAFLKRVHMMKVNTDFTSKTATDRMGWNCESLKNMCL